jgi:hypothetical protein
VASHEGLGSVELISELYAILELKLKGKIYPELKSSTYLHVLLISPYLS